MRRIERSHRVFSYSAEHEPCARLSPRETVLVETTNAFGDQKFEPGDTLADLDLEQADPLTGPLYVEGAEPGDSLAVHIEYIELVLGGALEIKLDFRFIEAQSVRRLFFPTLAALLIRLVGL